MADEPEKKEKEAPTPEGIGVPTSESVENDDEEIVEFEFNDDGEEDLKKTLKKLRADLKQANKEKEEYLLGWQKERADFANYCWKYGSGRASVKKKPAQAGCFLSLAPLWGLASFLQAEFSALFCPRITFQIS